MTREMTHPTKMADQRARLLARLRSGPLTVDQARWELGIKHPAARVWELRHDLNVRIASVRLDRQSVYVLMPTSDHYEAPRCGAVN